MPWFCALYFVLLLRLWTSNGQNTTEITHNHQALWTSYVDYFIYDFISHYKQQTYVKALHQKYQCKEMDNSVSQSPLILSEPCGRLSSHISPHRDASQTSIIWIIRLPQQLSLNISLLHVDIPYSHPDCKDGRLTLQQLTDKHQSLMFCGKPTAQDIVFTHNTKVTAMLTHSYKPLIIKLIYQYTTRPQFEITFTEPKVVNLNVDECYLFGKKLCAVPLMSIPIIAHSSELLQRAIHFLPHYGLIRSYHVYVSRAPGWDVVVYDGAGRKSPVLYNSYNKPIHTWSGTVVLQLYIEVVGRIDEKGGELQSKHNHVAISYIAHQQLIRDTERKPRMSTKRQIINDCNNEAFVINPARLFDNRTLTISVTSSDSYNVWCSIYVTGWRWNVETSMVFDGATHLYNHENTNVCIYGGLYFTTPIPTQSSFGECETLRRNSMFYNQIKLQKISAMYYAGYSRGNITLVFKGRNEIGAGDNNTWLFEPEQFKCIRFTCAYQFIFWNNSDISMDTFAVDGNRNVFQCILHYPFPSLFLNDNQIANKALLVNLTIGSWRIWKYSKHYDLEFAISVICHGQTVCKTDFVTGKMAGDNEVWSRDIYHGSVMINLYSRNVAYVSFQVMAHEVNRMYVDYNVARQYGCGYHKIQNQTKILSMNCKHFDIPLDEQPVYIQTEPFMQLQFTLAATCKWRECLLLTIRATGQHYGNAPAWIDVKLHDMNLYVTMVQGIELSWRLDPMCHSKISHDLGSCSLVVTTQLSGSHSHATCHVEDGHISCDTKLKKWTRHNNISIEATSDTNYKRLWQLGMYV